MDLSTRLRQARRSRGLSQERLAHLVGVVSRTVRRWESGDSDPHVADVVRLADVLECPGAWLVFGTGPSGLVDQAAPDATPSAASLGGAGGQ